MIMNRTGEVVYLVDNDGGTRQSLGELLAPLGHQTIGFSSAAEYLAYTRTDTSSCLILDMHLPDMNGLALQRQLGGEMSPPIVFVSAHCDFCAAVSAMKGGAVHFLLKPLEAGTLLAAVREALERDRKRRRRHAELAGLRTCYATLTPREKQIFALVADGILNKQIAGILDIADVTVALHRGNVMRKMEAESFAQLVRMAVALNISSMDGEAGVDRNELPVNSNQEPAVAISFAA